MVFRNRLDAKGFTEATIVRQGTDRIRVEIPINETSDTTDPNEISMFIGKPAKLELIDPNGNVIIEGKDIVSAQLQFNENEPVVGFKLQPEGAKAFAEATTEFQGQVITIELDGQVISAPTVNTPILAGEGIIEGGFTQDSARDLALQIESGALPIELEEIEVRSISASLGVDALSKSILAGAIGIAVLLLFMLIYYRLPGLVANMALIVYMLIVLILIATIPGVQLTLPGIAGIILGIGMAVDANVIIFERFKEELRTGKTLRSSLNSGFSKAFSAIIDANITTVIAAIVLMIFGTGPIKGFAYTLTIGIVTSMFTALVVTRLLLKLIMGLNIKNKKFYTIKGGQIK